MTSKTPEPTARNGASRPSIDVPALAARFGLKPQTANGKTEWHGPNPFESGATKDGFILYPEGNAFDRSTNTKYTRDKVAELAGLSTRRFESPDNPVKPKLERPRLDWANADAIFDYPDENGGLLFQVGRSGSGPNKIVSQRRPSSTGGWIHNLQSTPRVLYRLPDVLGADVVFICEGEQAADAINSRLEALGLYGEYVATTTSGGAGNSNKTDFAAALEGKRVGIFPDNDTPGDLHADDILKASCEQAAEVKRVELPNLPPKGDADDFFKMGGEIEALLALFEATPRWELPKPLPRFNLLSVPELFERPDPEFLIEQWLIQGSTILFTAKHESFKSFIALDMGAHVATGKPWHGFRIKRPGCVVYIAAEGAAGVKRRLQAWLAHYGETIGADRFFVLDMPLQLANDSDRRAFIGQISALSPSLIILDTLTRCAVGLDENSASDMGKISDAMGEMARETGAACMIVHHNNKNGDYRGSSALPGNVDTHLSCERKDEIVTLKLEKQKDFEKHKPILFEAQSVSIPNTQGEASSLIMARLETRSEGNYSLSDIAQRTLDAFVDVFKDGHISSSKWMKAVEEQKGIIGSNFYRAQTELVAKGIVKMVSGEKNGRGKNAPIYAVAPDWLPVEDEVTPQLQENSAGVAELVTPQLTPQLHTPLGVGVMELELRSDLNGGQSLTGEGE